MKTLKNLVLCFVLLCTAAILMAQAPQWQWVAWSEATDNQTLNLGHSLVVDNQGNQYVCGTFDGTVTFGTHVLTSLGGDFVYGDLFVAKLDAAGNWLWVVRAGGLSDDFGAGIALDDTGNVYVTGQFGGTATFGTHTLTASGDEDYCDIFVAKLDADGNWLWAVRAGGPYVDYAMSIALDDAGNCYVTGNFEGTATFGSHTVNASGDDMYNTDIFVAKLDQNGNWLWVSNGGGVGDDWAQELALDSAGNIYVTGDFELTATFGDHSLTITGDDDNSRDVFIAKLDQNGNWLWAAKAGGALWDTGYGIAVDNAGNAYVTGDFEGTAFFGDHTLTAAGDDYQNNGDIFIAKLDQNGNWLWAVGAGGPHGDTGLDIALDGSGKVYVCGAFGGTATFGDYTLAADESEMIYDIFVAKLDQNGNWLWVVQAGGASLDVATSLGLDGAGNVYVTGICGGMATFGDHATTATGWPSVFVAKLGSSSPIDDELAPQIASRLHDAWPNPFSKGGSTMIKADIPEHSTGTLNIYNLRGQKVASYSLRSGSHQISFSGDNLPAGIYLYSLQCGSFRETKKLVLLR